MFYSHNSCFAQICWSYFLEVKNFEQKKPPPYSLLVPPTFPHQTPNYLLLFIYGQTLARLVCFSCLAGWKGHGNDRPLTCVPRPQFPRWLSTPVILLYCTYIIQRLCVVLYANIQLGGDLLNHYLGTQNDGTQWAPAVPLQIITPNKGRSFGDFRLRMQCDTLGFPYCRRLPALGFFKRFCATFARHKE